jgi:hypothetical protein
MSLLATQAQTLHIFVWWCEHKQNPTQKKPRSVLLSGVVVRWWRQWTALAVVTMVTGDSGDSDHSGDRVDSDCLLTNKGVGTELFSVWQKRRVIVYGWPRSCAFLKTSSTCQCCCLCKRSGVGSSSTGTLNSYGNVWIRRPCLPFRIRMLCFLKVVVLDLARLSHTDVALLHFFLCD